jgi:hypothetical protein
LFLPEFGQFSFLATLETERTSAHDRSVARVAQLEQTKL